MRRSMPTRNSNAAVTSVQSCFLGWSMCVTLARWLDPISIQFIHNECRSFIVPSVHQFSLSLRAMASLLLIESQLSSLFHPISDLDLVLFPVY